MQNFLNRTCECQWCNIKLSTIRRKLKKGRIYNCEMHGIFVVLSPCRKFGGRQCDFCKKYYCDICFDLSQEYCKECRIPDKFVFKYFGR